MSNKVALSSRGIRPLKHKGMSSYNAVQKIKYLQKHNEKHMVQKAFEIYRNLHSTQKNEYVTNAVLNCCKKGLNKRLKFDDEIQVIDYIKDSIINTDDNIHAKTTLINIYGKMSDIDKATKIFNGITKDKRDIFVNNAMMNALNNNQKYEEIISFYQENIDGKHNNDDTFNTLFIKACINTNQYNKGKQLVDTLKDKDKDINTHNIKFWTTLIDFYGKSGDIDEALNIFYDHIPENDKDIASIGAMMNACNQNQKYEKSIELYEKYQDYKHNDISNNLFLKACINTANYDKVKKLLIDKDENIDSIEFNNTLIDFYGKTRDIDNALNTFNKIPANKKDNVTFNVMMNAYNDSKNYDKSIQLYEQYMNDNKCNDISNILLIKACMNKGDYNKGKKLIDSHINIKHNDDIKKHSVEFISTLIDFYSKIGDMNHALNIFNTLPSDKKDIVSITNMMNAYNNNEKFSESIELYEKYSDTIKHDDVSNTLFLKACINNGEYNKGQRMIDVYFEDVDIHSIEFINTLIAFYGKNSDIDNALNIFNNIPRHKCNIATISAMMNACNNNEEYAETVNLYNMCCNEKLEKDDYIYSEALVAAGNLVSPHQGSLIINDLNKTNNEAIINSFYVQSALITFHAKCGKFEEAVNIFNENINQYKENQMDALYYLYGAMMDCYAKNGDIEQLLFLFNELKTDKRRRTTRIPMRIYNIILNGCCHSGLIDKALSTFEEMKDIDNNIDPKSVNVLIDCLGRKGNEYLYQAEEIYDTYLECNRHYRFKLPALSSLLSSSRNHNDKIVGQKIFDKIKIILNENENELYSNDFALRPYIHWLNNG